MPSAVKQVNWLPQTKFLAPFIGADILARPELVQRLHIAVTNRPLTLISAPAGSGKTTLVAQWQAQAVDYQVAWFRLDEGDNDPATFLLGLVTSIRQINSTFKTRVDSFVTSIPNIEQRIRHLFGLLSNDILESGADRFALIIDDLHTITDAAILDALNYFLDYCPPQMSVVITSRYDPPLSLAGLRARGQLAEFKLDTLRFSPAEVRDFLNERLNLELNEADLSILQGKTAGWAASLRLLAVALGQTSESARRSNFIQHLARTERYIFDYLADEVLNEQPLRIRQFLLETSILDELTPALCRAVTAQSDAGQTLDEAFRRNLFLNTVKVDVADHSEATYRYHDLFAAFLRQRLEQERPTDVPELHRRAAEIQPQSEEAVKHYPAASQVAAAFQVQSTPFAVAVAAGKVRSKAYLHSLDDLLALTNGQKTRPPLREGVNDE